MSLTKQSNAYIQEFERRCVEYGIDADYEYEQYMERNWAGQTSVVKPPERRTKTASKIVKEASRINRNGVHGEKNESN